jgi:hypothetical protein
VDISNRFTALENLGTEVDTNRPRKTTGDHLCGLVVRVPEYRSRGPGSISGTTRFSEK